MIVLPVEKRLDWNNPPRMVLSIIFLNIVIFVFYQMGDSRKLSDALNTYNDCECFEYEWPLYLEYLDGLGEDVAALDAKSAYETSPALVKMQMMQDLGFYQYLVLHIDAFPERLENGDFDHLLDVSHEDAEEASESAETGFGGYDMQQLEQVLEQSDDEMQRAMIEMAMTQIRASQKADTVYLLNDEDLIIWKSQRKRVDKAVRETSYYSFGLVPQEISAVTLVSHQFLHGGIMHIFGNMLFLIMCGFAVEAALGAWRFLLFYLLAGIGAGLTQSFLNLESYTPLVGASGAISGVMAMYLAVFRLKKIDFFYWFYIFVGYFKAPALVILPLYIAKELIQFYSESGSNVAFMAHAGGFVVGAALIGILLLLNKDALDEEYIEQDQSIDPHQEALASIYKPLHNMRFDKSYQAIEQYLEEHPHDGQRRYLQICLAQLLEKPETQKLAYDFVADAQLCKKLPKQRLSIYEKFQAFIDKTMPIQGLTKLGLAFCKDEHIEPAEHLFIQLHRKAQHESLGIEDMLGVFARRLANYFDQQKDGKKREFYDAIADQYLV